jgi:hypothetical protein
MKSKAVSEILRIDIYSVPVEFGDGD